ncbi:MAG: DUF167 domain-containing protein [Candidatus Saccharibacteria bacterium]|nr:DUF167 domain-containing protein [Candidatus Saccharibacteria bacterium]
MKIVAQVKPGSRHRQEIIKKLDGTYTIYTKAPATENRANQAAITLLAHHFGIAKSAVRLTKGQTARCKTFDISAGGM